MKIVIDKDIPFIEGRIKGAEIVDIEDREIRPEVVKDADALLVRTRTKCGALLLQNSQVKLVATGTIGVDHIDREWCETNGITVRNSPGCNAPGVAQYVLSSLLKAGMDPEKDTIGIIGYGNVGRVVAKWAEELGFKVLISDAPRQELGFSDVDYRPMAEVLSKSDAVTLHVPLTKEGKYATYHLIGDKELEMMKPGAVLVNAARGGVVDESFLIPRLRSDGKSKPDLRAIIDVWEGEPEINAELADLAFISTQHIAGYSKEGKMRATRMILEALKDVMGVDVDLTGLELPMVPEITMTADIIANSYNPLEDSEILKSNIESFEKLRNGYNYRHEPGFGR